LGQAKKVANGRAEVRLSELEPIFTSFEVNCKEGRKSLGASKGKLSSSFCGIQIRLIGMSTSSAKIEVIWGDEILTDQ